MDASIVMTDKDRFSCNVFNKLLPSELSKVVHGGVA